MSVDDFGIEVLKKSAESIDNISRSEYQLRTKDPFIIANMQLNFKIAQGISLDNIMVNDFNEILINNSGQFLIEV